MQILIDSVLLANILCQSRHVVQNVLVNTDFQLLNELPRFMFHHVPHAQPAVVYLFLLITM